jgi:hypothetical protein
MFRILPSSGRFLNFTPRFENLLHALSRSSTALIRLLTTSGTGNPTSGVEGGRWDSHLWTICYSHTGMTKPSPKFFIPTRIPFKIVILFSSMIPS